MIDQKFIENFIHNHINLINNNQWDEVYYKLGYYTPDYESIGLFTEMCLLSDINPLNHMEKVPDYYLWGSTKIDILYIPENTKILGKLILCNSNVSKVRLHGNVQLNSAAWNGAKPTLQLFLNDNYMGVGFH